MTVDTALVGTLMAAVGGALAIWGLVVLARLNEQHKEWLRAEVAAHDETRRQLRQALAHVRHERRNRVLGLIEEHRSAN